MVATASRAVPPPKSTKADSANARSSSSSGSSSLGEQPNGKKPITSSPQIVENTLKDFYDYLKSIKETLQLQQEQEQQKQQQQQQKQKMENRDDDDNTLCTYGTNGDYSWYKQKQPQQQTADNSSSCAGEPSTNNVTFWTDRDTKKYLQRLNSFKTVIVEQIDRFPLHSQAGREILDVIQSAASRGAGSLLKSHTMVPVLRHVSQMVIYVSKLLQEIQVVDLDKLIDLMKHNQQAGHVMANKDVILLCGAARSGKTTTLHYMAGSKLEEVDVEGFFHLQPTRVKDAALANYKTACSDRDPVTDHLQTTSIRIGRRDVILCDTPGLGNDASPTSSSVELDIANGLGIVRALHGAKSIKPVFVLSRDEVRVRERFSAFDGETVANISRLLSKSQKLDLGPLNYIFTKYEEKHRDCLCKQFSVMSKNHAQSLNSNIMKKNQQQQQHNDNINDSEPNSSYHNHGSSRDARLMRKVLEDIAKKTAPKANIVMPLEGNHTEFVQNLWETSSTVQDPKTFFVPFVSFAALKKLQLQLRITLSDLRNSLVEEDHTTAVYRLRQLQELASVLPEAKDCAKLGEEAIKKHMMALWERVMASLERKDTSMAIHRSQQLVTLSEVLPEAKTNGTIAHDSVVMLRDLIHALQSDDYKICHDRLTKLTELAREFPEANKCAHFALRASIQHVAEFREKVVKLLENILYDTKDAKQFTSLLEKLSVEMDNVVHSEPLLLSCVNEGFVGLEKRDILAMNKLAQCSSEAFCIDQVQRLTDHLKQDLPNFKAENIDMDDLLKKKDAFLSSIERLKIVSVQLHQSPAGARAESIYHLAFQTFHDFVASVLKEAEDKYKSSWTDLDVFGRKLWFVAILLQGPLKNKPHTARREHSKIENLERRVLKLMLRLEIEVTRAMDRLKSFKFPDCNNILMKQNSIPEFGISELKAPRFLLISVAKNARIRKMLPNKVDVLEINVCIAMFDHALLNFWKKVVIRLEQDYAVIVAMQKVQKDPKEILQLARFLRTDITRVEKEFLGICGWSDDITNESESDLKRLIAVRDCVQTGVAKMEEMAKTRTKGLGLFACGGLNNVSENYLCKHQVSPE